jgi:hypothetical protein
MEVERIQTIPIPIVFERVSLIVQIVRVAQGFLNKKRNWRQVRITRNGTMIPIDFWALPVTELNLTMPIRSV